VAFDIICLVVYRCNLIYLFISNTQTQLIFTTPTMHIMIPKNGTCSLKGKQAMVSCDAPTRVNTNYPYAYTIQFFTSVVYSEYGFKLETSSKSTHTMNGTILVAAANQKPASICILEKYYVTESTAGSYVITKESQGPSGALCWFAEKSRQHYTKDIIASQRYATPRDNV